VGRVQDGFIAFVHGHPMVVPPTHAALAGSRPPSRTRSKEMPQERDTLGFGCAD
jgi:hypothetical protein